MSPVTELAVGGRERPPFNVIPAGTEHEQCPGPLTSSSLGRAVPENLACSCAVLGGESSSVCPSWSRDVTELVILQAQSETCIVPLRGRKDPDMKTATVYDKAGDAGLRREPATGARHGGP